MGRVLYDLAGAEPDRRFSPYCWRVKLALAHKGLAFDTVPWRFTDKDAIGFSGQGSVPVLVDGDRVLHESWDIACYLEDAYPDAPSLFGGPGGRALARFVNEWADATMLSALLPVVVMDIHAHLAPQDQAYFRTTREKRLGKTLEAAGAEREAALAAFRRLINPLRRTLKAQAFLGGEAPLYADYIVLGGFQWARCICPQRLLEEDDAVFAWRARMLASCGGIALSAKGYPV